MRVSVTNKVKRPGISPRRLKQIVAGALRRERMPDTAGVSIVLVDDPTIRRLNRRFLRKNRATDVLAFPLDGTRSGDPVTAPSRMLGEVVISIDRARAQASRAGHPVRVEVALLAVHGILHLTGYDDRSAAQAAAMDRRQRQILRDLGEEARA